ncbi:MAG: aldehyde dehydrogenase family protein, partial [Akkermansiaceae bacterium]|nr:aldehyde dehydrogenase family protein [Akkermansiaceae bacterium]
RFRSLLAGRGPALAQSLRTGFRDDPGEALASEIIPLAEACRFLEREVPRLLKTHRRGPGLSPIGLRIVERREPIGVILVIGPANYPFFLPGVQALQAVAAGNVAVLKPGLGGGPALRSMVELAREAGFPAAVFQVLPDTVEAGREAIACGPDKVVLTGSAESGGAVLGDLAERLIPAVVELSGCDAVFVREDADLGRVVPVLRFGLRWNRGATCIAPRRVFVARVLAADLERLLVEALGQDEAVALPGPNLEALRRTGAELEADGARKLCGEIMPNGRVTPHLYAGVEGRAPRIGDIFAPVLVITSVRHDEEALRLDSACPHGLGAVVFGRESGARELAKKIDAGCVTINDAIAPTADPRVSFGGRHRSGFGMTRGPHGVLELTVPKLVVERRGRFLPHLEEMTP